MYLPGLIIIAAVATAIKAEVNCNKPPPHVNINNCCEISDVLSEDVKEKCGAQMAEADNFGPHGGNHHGPPGHHHGPPGHRGPKFGPRHHCLLSCVVNETGILVDGELQEDNVNSYLNELFEDTEKVEFLNNKFRVCNEKRKDFETKWPEHRGPFHCPSNQNGMIIGCVHMQTFKDCPESFWSNTDECNEVREHFNQCRPFKEKGDENIEEEMEEAEEI